MIKADLLERLLNVIEHTNIIESHMLIIDTDRMTIIYFWFLAEPRPFSALLPMLQHVHIYRHFLSFSKVGVIRCGPHHVALQSL